MMAGQLLTIHDFLLEFDPASKMPFYVVQKNMQLLTYLTWSSIIPPIFGLPHPIILHLTTYEKNVRTQVFHAVIKVIPFSGTGCEFLKFCLPLARR